MKRFKFFKKENYFLNGNEYFSIVKLPEFSKLTLCFNFVFESNQFYQFFLKSNNEKANFIRTFSLRAGSQVRVQGFS